jgi:hypothetical protein
LDEPIVIGADCTSFVSDKFYSSSMIKIVSFCYLELANLPFHQNIDNYVALISQDAMFVGFSFVLSVTII